MNEKVKSGSRNVAIVGPYLSGKTTFLESLLFVTGAISRKGSVKDSNTVGDSAAESRDRHMSVEVSAASTEYNGIRFTFIDCPGSVEFAQETYNALIGVDAAIVVCEPIRERVLTLAPLFKFLDDWEIPHLVFVNKMDRANIHVLETLHALKAVSSRIVGGAVPKQYIPGVEMGVREFLTHGPLGFPIVDLSITLTNGSYHNFDSSEQAFKQAARLAMQTGIPQAEPTLLEPILRVDVTTPSEFTSKVLQLLSGRRGQILGYEGKNDWQGWDNVSAYLPQAEMQNFIVELRSLTLGVGSFHWEYDHLQEVPEKLAERVIHSNNK
ncbi:GTP-binding protein [Nostoc sp.]|uniref:GTP-binding protein n=1 Tax=Nostoc sp. TaxID=1180 RepID=UPI002FFB7B05